MRALLLLVASVAGLASPSQSQKLTNVADPSPWVESGKVATAVKSGIAVPLSAGTLQKSDLRQYDADGADLYAQYLTPDRRVFGTIFLYAPTLADTGLTFLATDEVIRRRWGSATRIATDELVPIAGVKAAGRRVVYEGANDGKKQLVSTAVFVRAGSWIVVGRVTGPAERADEIKKDVDALVAGISFPKGSEPLPANVIKIEPCQAPDRTVNANIAKPTAAEAGEIGLIAGPGAQAVNDKGHSVINPLRAMPDRLCRESIELWGTVALQIFRPVGTVDRPFPPRLYALYGDAGIMLEVSEDRDHPGSFYVLRHGVGRMYAFGKLDRLPSITQMRALIRHPENQPAIAMYASSFVDPSGNDNLTIYCSLTVEGCAETAPKPGSPTVQSSR